MGEEEKKIERLLVRHVSERGSARMREGGKEGCVQSNVCLGYYLKLRIREGEQKG